MVEKTCAILDSVRTSCPMNFSKRSPFDESSQGLENDQKNLYSRPVSSVAILFALLNFASNFVILPSRNPVKQVLFFEIFLNESRIVSTLGIPEVCFQRNDNLVELNRAFTVTFESSSFGLSLKNKVNNREWRNKNSKRERSRYSWCTIFFFKTFIYYTYFWYSRVLLSLFYVLFHYIICILDRWLARNRVRELLVRLEILPLKMISSTVDFSQKITGSLVQFLVYFCFVLRVSYKKSSVN